MSAVTCIIGAGSSGIAAAKALKDAGLAYDHFEASDRVGGNWAYENPNGMSSAYDTLHINTSRERMSYADFPMPKAYPTFPHHSHIARYFNDYVDHFGLRDAIEFRIWVEHCEPAGDGWDATIRRERSTETETRHYDALIVANGHHWDPRWPEPPFPGELEGEVIHAHDYKRAEQLKGRHVVVLGMGNSAMDIAVVASFVGASATIAARTGAHVIPKWWFGRPLDQWVTIPAMHLAPFRLNQWIYGRIIHAARGDQEVRYGIPTPDHGLLEAHPTVSSDFIARCGHGAITIKPNLAALEGDRVRFVDGSGTPCDLLIFATGYEITFPFFDPALISAPGNQIDLYFNVVDPRFDNLFFVGLTQPLGAIMPIAERQAKWIAMLLSGDGALPDQSTMRARIAKVREAMRQRYVASQRHTIQVDFDDYMLDLKLEMAASLRRAGASLGKVARTLVAADRRSARSQGLGVTAARVRAGPGGCRARSARDPAP